MASSESTYDERLGLADSFAEYKEQFSQKHYKLLVREALEETRVGSGRLKYILALARRCKSGALSAELLAEKVDKEHSSQQQEQMVGGDEQQGVGGGQAGGEDGSVAGYEDIDTEVDEPENQSTNEGEEEEEEEEEEGEKQEVADDAEVNDLLEKYKKGFFRKNGWARVTKTFVLPGEGYWLDANNIKTIRKSTHKDFANATPKPMPVYIDGNPYCATETKVLLSAQERGYHLCKRVAVSADGSIFRATDGEILAILAKTKGAPTTDAQTYVRAVVELRRRHALESGGGQSDSGHSASGRKRRRISAAHSTESDCHPTADNTPD